MLRSVLSVIVGYIVIIILTTVTIFGLAAIFPQSYGSYEGELPHVGWIIFNLIYGAGFAVVGGYVTARLAQRAEVKHALALGILMVVLSIPSLLVGTTGGEGAPAQPLWYLLALPVLALPAAWLGGWLRARQVTG